MNILIYKPEQLSDGYIKIVRPTQIEHIQSVLKLSDGDRLRIAKLNDKLGQGRIAKLAQDYILIEPLEGFEEPPAALPCTLILALPRPQQLKRLLVHISSLGIKEIHLIQSTRVEKNYWQSPKLKDAESYLIEGLEQALDCVLPKLYLHKNYQFFLKNSLKDIIKNKELWLAHPGKHEKAKQQAHGEHAVLIGPEGGFVPKEVEDFEEMGAKKIQLGRRILKVETALPVLIGAMFQH